MGRNQIFELSGIEVEVTLSFNFKTEKKFVNYIFFEFHIIIIELQQYKMKNEKFANSIFKRKEKNMNEYKYIQPCCRKMSYQFT